MNRIALLGVTLLLQSSLALAQTEWSSSIGVSGDGNGSRGVAGSLDAGFDSGNSLTGSVGVNHPAEGFTQSNSVSASLDYNHMLSDWMLSIGVAGGKRDGFSSKKLRGSVAWQPGNWYLAAQLEQSRIDSTTHIVGITRTVNLADKFTVSGGGASIGYAGEEGLSVFASYMDYNAPAGARFQDVNQLTARLLANEINRLAADSRVERVRLEYRASGLPFSSSSNNTTSVLSQSVSLSLGYSLGGHQWYLDYYRDTSAEFDVDMRSYSLRWLLPLATDRNRLELWLGTSDAGGNRTTFGGMRVLFYW